MVVMLLQAGLIVMQQERTRGAAGGGTEKATGGEAGLEEKEYGGRCVEEDALRRWWYMMLRGKHDEENAMGKTEATIDDDGIQHMTPVTDVLVHGKRMPSRESRSTSDVGRAREGGIRGDAGRNVALQDQISAEMTPPAARGKGRAMSSANDGC